jgi:helix-turn-helix protein
MLDSAMRQRRSVNARFGGLARRWGVLLPAGRRNRIPLGLSLAEQVVMEQLLSHYDENGVWRSFSQKVLANELGVTRQTISEHLKRLWRLGLVGTRTDPRFGTRAATLIYCLEPYLAVLAMREGSDHFDRVLWAEGNDRLLRFPEDVEWGTWVWDVESIETFCGAYLVTEPPRSLAVSVTALLAEESEGRPDRMSVPPTEEDNHLFRRTSVQEPEPPIAKELKTPVHQQTKTSVPKTDPQQTESSVIEVLDRISKQ